MDDPAFVSEARNRTEAIWTAIHAHPFVRAIGGGSLPRDRFEFYLRQDYVYLVDFSRVLALAAAKAGDVETMQFFSSVLQATIHSEMELHRRTSADFGIPVEALEATEPAMITAAYTSALLRTCYEGTLGDILAILLPCAAGYVEVADRLGRSGLPGDRHCRDWIETYTSAEMRAMADWLVDRTNRAAAAGTGADRGRWHALYRMSARYELLFFEMAWTMSVWPEPVPV